MFEPKKILVPTDFSSHADQALKAAVDMAKQFNSKLFLLHALDQEIHETAIDYGLTAEQVERMIEMNTAKSIEKMKAAAAAIEGTEAMDITYDVVKGVPYDVILYEQKQKAADLIVMSPYGSTGMARYLIGGVTEKVIKNADVPVLIVR